jgi:hypothetical protein
MRSETPAIDPAAVAIRIQGAADRRQSMAIMGSPLSRALAAGDERLDPVTMFVRKCALSD